MPIEHYTHGTILTGDSVEFFRFCQLRMAVQLECNGIKMTRGRMVWTRVKDEYNIPGKREDVLRWLEAKVDELRPQQEHVENGKRYVGGQEVQ